MSVNQHISCNEVILFIPVLCTTIQIALLEVKKAIVWASAHGPQCVGGVSFMLQKGKFILNEIAKFRRICCMKSKVMNI